MMSCFFVSDLHGQERRYSVLSALILKESPGAVFLGGDLLCAGGIFSNSGMDYRSSFLQDIVIDGFGKLKKAMKDTYPAVYIILGNDDPRSLETEIRQAENDGLWHYVHMGEALFESHPVLGYSCIPPTPFFFKDWEKYDVSQFVDPGCISPEEGIRTIPETSASLQFSTIQEDIITLVEGKDVSNAILLFHAPPYDTQLDRAALDGKLVDHVPLDVHVGSIAIREFIKKYQPLITLHGHVHESVQLTGNWKEKIGRTWSYSAAHHGRELALVRFDPESPSTATRELV
jgi:Icc-related predicted phosphoesterase